jgi:hypothetical protein
MDKIKCNSKILFIKDPPGGLDSSILPSFLQEPSAGCSAIAPKSDWKELQLFGKMEEN